MSIRKRKKRRDFSHFLDKAMNRTPNSFVFEASLLMWSLSLHPISPSVEHPRQEERKRLHAFHLDSFRHSPDQIPRLLLSSLINRSLVQSFSMVFVFLKFGT
ncbi:hypothetical protein SAY86_029081 [Trapa natans]|uniref:Uncharacterized protein n=1 Tax=Trapa natans TaxID=22666 RepID=A0AAN7M0Q3_TRANT|nr:hypothetical protein SAY86_029081 [Trapa natans]